MSGALPSSEVLTRTAASEAVEAIGWRYLLGTLVAAVPVASLRVGVEVAATAAAACHPDGDSHLRVDVRPDRVELSLQTRAVAAVTRRDVQLAEALTRALAAAGHRPRGATSADGARPVQMLEIAVDALDISAILPFWRAVLGYTDEPGYEGLQNAIVDPAGLLPALWFQQMEAPRPQRNRIHLDVTVAHDEAPARVRAALAAGGVLVSDDEARAFWVLADAEGNEACVCTWQDRDGEVTA